MSQEKIIQVARGLKKADLVIKNANVINVLSEEIHRADIAIADGIIAGIGENYSGEKEMFKPAEVIARNNSMESTLFLDITATLPPF